VAGGYSKLFGSIITSSLWVEDHIVIRVWIAMLASCNAKGEVEGAVPGFASLCRITPDEMREALSILLAPDPDSRSKTLEGRRLVEIPGGWRIVNYLEYRERLQEKEGSKAQAMRESRQRKKEVTDGNALPNVTLPASASVDAVVPLLSLDTSLKQKKKNVPRIKTTELKPDSVKAFEVTWNKPPKTVRQWNKDTKDYEEVPVAKGSRMKAERNFQGIVDAGVATAKELCYAFQAYCLEGEGPKKGFFQHLSTFFGPEKSTYLEWLERARQIIREST
jgi:hypothetical protein